LENGVIVDHAETGDSGLLNIQVTICDRPYRLKVKPEEEETVRNAARHISDKIKELQEQFAGKDKQDFLAMAALLISVDKLSPENKQPADNSEILDELEQLNRQIEKAISF